MRADALNLQHLAKTEQLVKARRGHLDLAMVHEVDQAAQTGVVHVTQDHHRVGAWVRLENFLEVGAAG